VAAPKRSNLLVVIGLVVAVLGAAMVVLIVRNNNHKASAVTASSGDAAVVVAKQGLSAGTAGDDLISGNQVELKSVNPASRAPDAITSLAELSGRLLTVDVKSGDQIRLAGLRSATLRKDSIKPPEGKQALAVALSFVPGVAGYVGPNDTINVYANVTKAPADPAKKLAVPCVQLIVPGVQVLDVSDQVAPQRAQAQPTVERANGADLTYLLAVDPVQAQTLIFYSSQESLYLTLVPKGQAPSNTIPCAGYPAEVRAQ
jgi:Flp pilus assembly protein CpaB